MKGPQHGSCMAHGGNGPPTSSAAVHRRDGIRERAMLHRCGAAGLRVSELGSRPLQALEFYPRPRVQVLGKGRKERTLPLWKETAVARRHWLAGRGDTPARALFVNAHGAPMTRSGFTSILHKPMKTPPKRVHRYRRHVFHRMSGGIPVPGGCGKPRGISGKWPCGEGLMLGKRPQSISELIPRNSVRLWMRGYRRH
jgi:integrase